MDSSKKRDSEALGSSSSPDANDLASQVMVSKKSRGKYVFVAAVLVVVLAGAGVGAYFSKDTLFKDMSSTTAAEASPTPSSESKSEEQEIADALLESVEQLEASIEQDEKDLEAIENSTAAAKSVGGGLNEDELEES